MVRETILKVVDQAKKVEGFEMISASQRMQLQRFTMYLCMVEGVVCSVQPPGAEMEAQLVLVLTLAIRNEPVDA